MDVFDSPSFDQHENVVFAHDPRSGLRAIIAVHSLALGPAAGGCRMWPYEDTRAALEDVLRLSRGMSYKNAMADLPFGGGKSVIIGDPKKDKTEPLLEAFGARVQALGGQYIVAEDVGTTVQDMEIVARRTSYVSGLKRADRFGGDPSPKTALGVFLGIIAAVKHRLDRSDMAGVRVAVQGTGSVGRHLCEMLARSGAELIVADVNRAAAERMAQAYGAHLVSPEAILSVEAEVFAPCALGGVINEMSVPLIRAPIVAGAANNQLATDLDGQRLHDRGVLFAPDYVINAGGIISVAHERLELGGDREVDSAIARIPGRLTEIFSRARLENRPTSEVADRFAQEKIAAVSRRAVA